MIMSTILEHSANASITIEYKGKIKYGRIPQWIKEKQLESYYNSMSTFYSECLDELMLPKRFDKKELHETLMHILRSLMNTDNEFTKLIIRLVSNYPRFPMDTKSASEWILSLKALNTRVAQAGFKLNEKIALDSLRSDIPYVVFSNLCLGNYTISYFHEYKAKATEQHFRRNLLLAAGRMNIPRKKNAIRNYFQMIEPIETMFKDVIKNQFKLWLLMTLYNSKDIKEFLKGPRFLSINKIDREHFTKLTLKHEEVLEEFRRQLFQVEPTLFNPIQIHKPTQTMWKDMVLIRIGGESKIER